VTGDHDAGVRALMRAVLLDAIGCLSGEGIKPSHRARVAMQARAWFARRGRDSLFTFDSICDVLGLDGERLRDRLHVAGGSRQALLSLAAASSDGDADAPDEHHGDADAPDEPHGDADRSSVRVA